MPDHWIRTPQAVPRALLLEDPELALSSRLHIIEAAETSIDLQYFIWQNDDTGILMIEKLLQAADCGVRIRALIDDVKLIGLIDRVSALNQHPNIEIRIYNPFSVRLRFLFAAYPDLMGRVLGIVWELVVLVSRRRSVAEPRRAGRLYHRWFFN